MTNAGKGALPRLKGIKLLRKLSQTGFLLVKSTALAGQATSPPGPWCLVRQAKDGGYKPVALPDEGDINQWLSGGVLERCKDKLTPTKAGRAFMKRALYSGPEHAHLVQHQARSTRPHPEGGSKPDIEINGKESPLAWLATRRDTAGKPMIEAYQYAAGERLRDDYERARLTNDVGSSWQQMGQPLARRRGGTHALNLTDAKLAAKQRVIAALEAVGPELSVILIDVCCDQLKLGVVEKRFDLPRRSGKVLLRMGLNQLARHYGLLGDDGAQTRLSERIRHWGDADYRPVIDGVTNGSGG